LALVEKWRSCRIDFIKKVSVYAAGGMGRCGRGIVDSWCQDTSHHMLNLSSVRPVVARKCLLEVETVRYQCWSVHETVRHWPDTLAAVGWCRNVLGPKCPGSAVSWHQEYYCRDDWLRVGRVMLILEHNYVPVIIDGEGEGRRWRWDQRLQLINNLYSSVFKKISGSEQG